MNKKLPLGNIALAALSLCVTLLLVEFALRSVVPVDVRRPIEFRIPDPVLGWVLQPNTTYSYVTPEGTVSVTYNSQGWRDLEHKVEKPEGVFRILVLGDSFMEANSVKLDDTFHRRVEEFARATGNNVEVINMAVAGYGTLQEYLVFEKFGRLYHPDLVIVGFFDGNDLANNSLELASILIDPGQITNSRPFLDTTVSNWTITPVDFESSQIIFTRSRDAIEAERSKLTEKIVLLRLLNNGLKRLNLPERLQNQEVPADPVDKSQREMARIGVHYCVEPAAYTRAWDTTARIFARFQQDVEASGSKLVVFTVPGIEEVSPEYMEGVKAGVAYPEKLCLEEAPGQARLNRLLTELNIEQISLLAEFRKATREDGLNLYQSDLHWNPAGHELAAKTVVSELIRRGLLPVAVTETVP